MPRRQSLHPKAQPEYWEELYTAIEKEHAMLRELNEMEMGMVSGGGDEVIVTGVRRPRREHFMHGYTQVYDFSSLNQFSGGGGGGGGFGFGPYPNELSGNYYDQQPETPIAEDPQPTDENCRIVYDIATIEVTRNGVTEQVPYPVEICD